MEKNKLENVNDKGQTAGSPIIIVEKPLRAAILFLVVIALGLLAINQALGFFYKAQFLKSPCGLCAELNPEVKECIDFLNSPRPSYWIGGEGTDGWSNPFNESNPYNITVYP